MLEPIPTTKVAEKETSQNANGNFEVEICSKQGNLLLYQAAKTDDHGFEFSYPVGNGTIEMKSDSVKEKVKLTLPVKLNKSLSALVELDQIQPKYLTTSATFDWAPCKHFNASSKLSFDSQSSKLLYGFSSFSKMKLPFFSWKTEVSKLPNSSLIATSLTSKLLGCGLSYNNGRVIPAVYAKIPLPFKSNFQFEFRTPIIFATKFTLGFEFRSILAFKKFQSSVYLAPYLGYHEIRVGTQKKICNQKVSLGARFIHHYTQWDADFGARIKGKNCSLTCLLSQNEIASGTVGFNIAPKTKLVTGIAYGPLHSAGSIAILSARLTLDPEEKAEKKGKKEKKAFKNCKCENGSCKLN